MATQPVLGAETLPHPSSYSEGIDYRGTGHIMADGDAVFQYTSTSPRRTFTLVYANISAADYTTINTALNAFATDADGILGFTPPTGESSITVTRDPASRMSTFTAIGVAGTLYWSGTIVLREV